MGYVKFSAKLLCVRARVRLSISHVLFLLLLAPAFLFAQSGNQSSLHLDTGEHIFKSACIACHGPDGKGTPKTIAGFEPPDSFPDFTRCDQTTAEPNSAWQDVITHGGRSRGFSQIMPAFGDALTTEQISKVVKYLRSFCREKGWARGELNLPRALVTEKAYPEDEVVISSAVNARGAPGVSTDVIHEQRFGVKNQIEVDVPIDFLDTNHVWHGGVGDTTHGLGTGTTTFETFAAFDQLFPTNTFVQFQMGADLPRHTDIAPQSIFWRTAVGQSFAANHGLGRLWSPMVEFLADRDLTTGAKTNWDVLPQMQVTISHRQHIKADLGVRTPVSNTAGRPVQLMFYILWDWQDGKLTEGW